MSLFIFPSEHNDAVANTYGKLRVLNDDSILIPLEYDLESDIFDSLQVANVTQFFEVKLLSIKAIAMYHYHACNQLKGTIHVDIGKDVATLYTAYHLTRYRKTLTPEEQVPIFVTIHAPHAMMQEEMIWWKTHPFLRRRLVLDTLMDVDNVFVTTQEAAGVLFARYPKLERDIDGAPGLEGLVDLGPVVAEETNAPPTLASLEGG